MGKSVNQAKQLFVAKSYAEITDSAKAVGQIYAKQSADKEDLILKYVNVKGEQVGSGIIPVANILHVKAASAESQREYLKEWEVTVSDKVNSGNLKADVNYTLSINIGNYLDNSDVNKYNKVVGVHAYDDMTKSDFYKQLAMDVAKNFSKEIDKPLKVFIGTTEIEPNTTEEDLEDLTATSIIIKEAEPYWYRNSFDLKRYDIHVESGDVDISGKRPWATIEETVSTTNYIGDGKKTAELEDFCMTLSSDWAHKGFTTPLSPETMVDPTQEYNYLNIHWCYVGNNESPQKSEKDIVVVSTEKSVINSIISAINTATGKSYDTLKVG